MNTIKAICEKIEKGYLVKSPLVGVYSEIPIEGQLLNSPMSCGFIQVLGCKYHVQLSDKISGHVKRTNLNQNYGVNYNEVLFRLETIELGQENTVDVAQDAAKENEKAILSSIDGIFYSRPAPDEPSFVSVGSSIKKGQVLGLVEVMKTFNQIIYSGNHLPETAIIKEIRVEDGREVKNQQILFTIE